MSEVSGVWVKVYPEYAGGGDPDAPGAAVIGGATGAVTESSFTENGQAYDVYEFLGSGELVVSQPGFVDAVVVGAGGGGGGDRAAGGGGAGGLLNVPNAYLSDTPVTVVVGAGGNGGGGAAANDFHIGNNGDASSLGSYFSPGGGGGEGRWNGGNGLNGASGGGGSRSGTGGAGTNGIGKDGGNGMDGTGGGGGGGASTTGQQGTTSNGGNGGDGKSITIAESPKVLAGGGGGGCYASKTSAGSGGIGGGGAGSKGNAVGSPGQANTGGGGGGVGESTTTPPKKGGSGGSGIVIVRVKVASESYPFSTRTTAPRTAHAARIEDGIVRQVIVIPHLDDDDAKITEYCNRIGLPGTWVDTSYTGSRRGKYAGVGDLFDLNTRNAEFVSPVEASE